MVPGATAGRLLLLLPMRVAAGPCGQQAEHKAAYSRMGTPALPSQDLL